MALPGLEPDYSGSDEGLLPEVVPAVAQVSGTYGRPTTAPSANEAVLPTPNCSNVASAFQDLLELAKQAGIDPRHPTMEAAAAAVEELVAYIVSKPTEER